MGYPDLADPNRRGRMVSDYSKWHLNDYMTCDIAGCSHTGPYRDFNMYNVHQDDPNFRQYSRVDVCKVKCGCKSPCAGRYDSRRLKPPRSAVPGFMAERANNHKKCDSLQRELNRVHEKCTKLDAKIQSTLPNSS